MEISLIGIFLEGILSFLSPCVLPLLPLYMSYLAGNNKDVDEDGYIRYKTLKVFITTIFFVLGISFTFLLLSFSISILKEYIEEYASVISIVGGTVLIFFGLHETGLIHIDVLDKELKLKFNLHLEKINYFKAFLLGFVFSLGWSPCIGPMLGSAVMMAATSNQGYLYILLYGLGLVIPFLLTGLMTSTILNFLNNKNNLYKWVLRIAGVIIICFGLYMIYDASKDIVSLNENNETNIDENYIMNYDFFDQDNKTLNLNDYKGKYVFLNFSATWCTYCNVERPHYIEFNNSNNEVECLYVMSPTQDYSVENIMKHIEDNDINLRTIIDTKDLLFGYCGISSFPTIFVISPDSKFLCYYSGTLGLEGFNDLLTYAKELYEQQ